MQEMKNVSESYKEMLKEYYKKLDKSTMAINAFKKAIEVLDSVPKEDPEKEACRRAVNAIKSKIPSYLKDIIINQKEI